MSQAKSPGAQAEQKSSADEIADQFMTDPAFAACRADEALWMAATVNDGMESSAHLARILGQHLPLHDKAAGDELRTYFASVNSLAEKEGLTQEAVARLLNEDE